MVDWLEARGGYLGVLHFSDLPFSPRRAYWLSGNKPGDIRGAHAHKEMQQVLVCLTGAAVVRVFDGSIWKELPLRAHGVEVYVPPRTWREISITDPGTVILALVSTDYDYSDYIFDQDEFRSWLMNSSG